jgi:hypothetical protein
MSKEYKLPGSLLLVVIFGNSILLLNKSSEGGF